MSGVGLEVLLEGLVPEIAYSGQKGVSITELLKIVRQYHQSLDGQHASTQGDAAAGAAEDPDLERSLSDAEMASARWAWDWLRTRPQILINGNKRWNRLELSEVLALPESDAVDPALASASGVATGTEHAKGKGSKKALTARPRIHPSEELVWQTLTRHGVDYKRVPALEWACLQGIASARAEGILQSDLRRLVNQDKRSLPKRTDSLARKGYVAKRTVVVQKMKTSRLWLIDFAPPLVEEETHGLDLSPETLSRDLEPVPWHHRWTGSNIDMDALGRTAVGVVKAFNVIRYSDLRSKMGVAGKRWQMKTLAKNCQRLVDIGVLKYTAASFPGSRKVFKDCLKFVREPSAEEWERFLATGKRTSLYSDPTRNREPKPNALALFQKSEDGGQGSADARTKLKRIFSGWTPEKPLAQTVFEVIRSAGPEGASNPQVSVATVGYQHRRYLSSYLMKVAETQQPPHLRKFQVVSKLVRVGKTSAYMFSAPEATEQPSLFEGKEKVEQASNENDPYGFGTVRDKAFGTGDFSLDDMSRVARKMHPSSKRRFLSRTKSGGRMAGTEALPEDDLEQETHLAFDDRQPADAETGHQLPGRPDETLPDDAALAEGEVVEPSGAQEHVQPTTAASSAPSAVAAAQNERAITAQRSEDLVMDVRYNGIAGKIRVHCSDRTLSFLRSGRGSKKPLIIPVDDNLDEPAIQDVPGSDERSLVLVKGPKDGAPAWTYVFIFDDESHGTASLILQELAKMKQPGYGEPGPDEPLTGQEIEVAAEQVAAEPDPSASTPAKGRGRGGARMKGKGKRKRGQALSAGAKPYVCPKCGGAWKNDLGLKYHLEKAQVPCNPNFDPSAFLERSRKRRKPSPVPPSEARDDGTPGQIRKSRSVRKSDRRAARTELNVRSGMRPAQDAVGKIRGLDVSDSSLVEDPASWISERQVLVSRLAALQAGVRATTGVESGAEAPSPAAAKDGPPRENINGRLPTLSGASLRSMMPARLVPYAEPVASVGDDASQTQAAVDRSPLSDVPRGNAQSNLTLSSLPTAPSTPSAHRLFDGGVTASGSGDGATPSRSALNSTTPVPTDGSPRPDRDPAASPLQSESLPSQQDLSQSEYPPFPQPRDSDFGGEVGAQMSAAHDEPAGFKPFVPSTNYDRISTDAKKRTVQAFEIINYLLDNTCGVFPGDRALFYALTKVFLREFKNQMPPTWKNYTSALRALETRKLAVVHTHMLKTERGRLQTCTMLIRVGVDPNGMIPTVMKQKMREAFPNIYIPPAFSPTQEELALLQELDKDMPPTAGKEGSKPNANGQKFRSRRKIEDVEVFNAPYYTQNAPPAELRKDPLRIRGYDWVAEQPELFGRKRSAADEPVARPSPKKAKTEVHETTLGPQTPGGLYDDIPVDPEILKDAESPTSGLSKNGPAGGEQGSPSVLEAIKAYSLLPARPWGRGRRRLSLSHTPLSKLPPELGRSRNPGLATLPGNFNGSHISGSTIQFASPVVRTSFSNTSFGDGAEEAEDDWSQSASRESSEDILETLAIQEPEAGQEAVVEDPKKLRFILPSVLEPDSNGWPPLSTGFFEYHDTSFTLQGWMPSQKWLLTQNLPLSAEEMLETQSAGKIRLCDWVDREYARLCSFVNQCAAWEQSQPGTAVMMGVSVTPGSIYINVSAPRSKSNSRVASLIWDDETQYNLETLPYEDLEDDDNEGAIYVEDNQETATAMARDGQPVPKKRRVQKPPAGQPRRMQGRPPKLKLAPIKTMREHTAYPRTAEDFLRHPDDADEEVDWSSENVRLAAFIVVTTLLGGVDRVVDWGLMLRLMPDQTISQLRHYWCALKKDRLSTIVSLTEKFRRAFLKAYENNEIPPIDFDNILAYDWKFLIKWTTKLDMAEWRALPGTRKALDEGFTVTKFEHGNREWREAFYHPQRSIFNKFQDATSEPLAFPVDAASDPKPGTEMVVAMSWTRSLCVTPVEAYTADAVLHKRNSLFPNRSKTEITELMIKGVDQLQREGVISKSSSKWSNGRRWRFNTRVLDALEKAGQQEKFEKAAQFKKELDQAFRAGEKKRVTYITNDGMIMALLNLQAGGRVRIETTGQPNVPLGHEPGNYETRKYTKKYMHFRLDVVPTESYLFDDCGGGGGGGGEHGNTELADLRARIKAAAPPLSGPGGAVPVWCDVFGRVDAERWLKYLSAVLITLASRGSMRADELVKTLRPVIMEFEAELILGWTAGLGLLETQLEGCAPALGEWWWIAVEVQREAFSTPVRR